MAKTSKRAAAARKARSDKPRKSRKVREAFPEDAPQEFLNRDLEWIEFNARVLHEAMDLRTPLLERVRFLGIFSSNLDEFFMKRLGGIKRQVELGLQRKSGGLNPLQQLAAIRSRVTQLLTQQADTFQNVLQIELAQAGIHILPYSSLTETEKKFASHYFRQNVFPILTPLAIDPGLPFPFISNLSTSLAVALQYPDREEKLFARIKVPAIFPQFVLVRGDDATSKQVRYISLIDLITENLRDLFPDMTVVGVMPFRVTRNAEIEHEDEDETEDLLEMIAEELKQRRFAEVVRLEHGPKPDEWMLRFLMDELELTDAEVFELPSLLNYSDLKPIMDLAIPALKYEPWAPTASPRLIDEHESIFSVIREGDLLVHHPYESFVASVERFIKQAVDDPKVLAIKMTLYRTGDDSPFIPLLIRAAERGKQVVVLIELKARFDEERNIHWAQELENAGVHVVYGVIGLKTHAKVALVIRQDPDQIRSYAHFGTGNYHKETAKTYTDVGLFTCQQAFTEDAVELFHFLTGRSLQRSYRKLLVAPINMKDQFLAKIAREAEHAKAGRPARIIAKCNSLEDSGIGRALYEASRAGVKIELIVRGFCSLRPNVVGMSDNIRVISVIGRFLEHSRIFFFQNGAIDPLDGEFFFGSADWMYRNLLARVETVVPIEEKKLRERLWEIFELMLNDRRQAWEMQPDGSYVQYKPTQPIEDVGSQKRLMELTAKRAEEARRRQGMEEVGDE
jgi:polyphosphate kinase